MKKYNKLPDRVAYRKELRRERRRRGIDGERHAILRRFASFDFIQSRFCAGKGGKDVSHCKDGRLRLEDRSKNRARNGANGKSTKW